MIFSSLGLLIPVGGSSTAKCNTLGSNFVTETHALVIRTHQWYIVTAGGKYMTRYVRILR